MTRKEREHQYSDKEVEFLRSNAPVLSRKELAARFNEEFGYDFNSIRILSWCRSHALFGDNVGVHHCYSEEEVQFLKDNINGKTRKELTELFNKRFGHNFTENRLSGYCKSKGILNEDYHRNSFSKEEIDYLRTYSATQYDSVTTSELERLFGNHRSLGEVRAKRRALGIRRPYCNRVDWKTLPVGSERLYGVKYGRPIVYVKVACGAGKNKDWVQKDFLVWKEHTGSELPKGYGLHHLDNDPMNCNIDNLILIPIKYMAQFTNNDWWSASPEIKKVAVRWCDYHFALKEFEDK